MEWTEGEATGESEVTCGGTIGGTQKWVQVMLFKFLSFRLPCSSFIIPSRSNTVNFFQRRNEDVLWKTVTNITKYGARKGRGKTRQMYRRLSDYYKIGTLESSPMRIRYPGLNERIPNNVTEPMYFEEQTKEERDASFKVNKMELAKKPPKASRKLLKEKLSAWERGFSGGQWLGQKLGPPPENLEAGVNFDDFQCICFQVSRLCTMKPGVGRKHSIRAVVFIGNGKGVGGFAFTRAPVFQSQTAVSNAIRRASRKLFYVERFEDRTIYQLLGIKDLYVRTEGSTTNYIGIVYAFLTGLVHQESHKQCADRTRLHVVELNPNRMFFPKIVASPVNAPVKLDDEVTSIERMRLEDFYGEGRFPQNYGKQILSYRNHLGHLHAEWKRHPYRNMERRIIRFLADGEFKRWTRRERKKWSDRQHEMVTNGQKPMPLGIGLSDWIPMEGEDNVFLGPLTNLLPPIDFAVDQNNDETALDLTQKEMKKN
uniref:Small ribosomal subunit protein uS5m n=1 Tax=Meloidogyne hapla TaxID=6305 RepID=A0A1I8BM95_MELHA